MTPQNQIKALAELDGWTYSGFTWTSPKGSRYADRVKRLTSHSPLELIPLDQILPAYLTSYDAIIPLRVKVCNTPALKVAWLNHARTIIARRIKLVSDFDIASIKPDEDCEALLRATGKWTDDE